MRQPPSGFASNSFKVITAKVIDVSKPTQFFWRGSKGCPVQLNPGSYARATNVNFCKATNFIANITQIERNESEEENNWKKNLESSVEIRF